VFTLLLFTWYRKKVLKELIRVVAPYPQLSRPLIICILRDRLMEHNKGAKLLRHCFTTLPYEVCSVCAPNGAIHYCAQGTLIDRLLIFS
jgi:hypothetical protein